MGARGSVALKQPVALELQRVNQIKRWSEETMFFAASRNLLDVLINAEQRLVKAGTVTTNGLAQYHESQRDNLGATILHIAVLCNSGQIVRYLTTTYAGTALIDARYTEGRYRGETALHMAIVKRSLLFVRLLVQGGCDTNHHVDGAFFCPSSSEFGGFYFGSTPLHFAVATDQANMVEYLLMHGGVIASEDVFSNNTAMHMAVLHQLPHIYDLLIAYDESGIDRHTNKDGLTPLQLAAAIGSQIMCDHILNNIKEVGWTFGTISEHMYPIDQIDTYRQRKTEPRGMLHLIVSGGTLDHARLLRIRVIEELLTEKWVKFARLVFYLQIIVYLVLVLMATYSSVSDKVNLEEYSNPAEIVVLDLIVFIVVMTESLFESHDVFVAIFKPKSHYRSFIYNNITQTCVSWGMRISVLLTFIMEVANAGDQHRRGCRALALVFLYQYLLNLLRNFRITGNFVMLLEQMVVRTMQWVLVFVFLLVAFALGFYVLFRETDDPEFNAVGILMITLIQWTVGQVEYTGDYKVSANRSVGVILFVIFSFLVSTIMFNLLIALMSTAYLKLSENSELYASLSLATNILTIERRLLHLPFLHRFLRCGKSGTACGFMGSQDVYYKVVVVKQVDTKEAPKNFRVKYLPGPLQSQTEYSDRLKTIIATSKFPRSVLQRPYTSIRRIVSRYDPDGTQVLSREAFRFLMIDLFADVDERPTMTDSELRDLAIALDGGDQDNRIAVESIYLFFRAIRRQWVSDARRTALIIVDMQNDFVLPGRALAVPGAQSIILSINRLRQNSFTMVVFTQDWHPADHCSFGNDGDKDVMTGDHNVVAERWPPHCVQETDGAQIVDGLPIRQTDVIIKKGWEQNVDAYSAFWDCEHRHETDLFGHLFDNDIDTLIICGVAYDVCVAETARDASIHGFDTYVAMDAVKAIDDGRRREAGLMLSHFNVRAARGDDISKILATPGRSGPDYFQPNLKKLQHFHKTILQSRKRPNEKYTVRPMHSFDTIDS